jgi:hypothetical protein
MNENMETAEARRAAILDEAVHAADRIIVEQSDGSRETLAYLTIALAERFVKNAAIISQAEVWKREIQEAVRK